LQKEINTLFCATLEGIDAKIIEVEATFTKALPSFSVVGLAGSDIQESKERVRASLLTNGFRFPPLKITINLSPSDIKKSGTHFDLPIALLIAMNRSSIESKDTFVFGELGLDGRVKSSSMLFPIILSLKEQALIKRAIIPKEAMGALGHIPNIDFIPVATLSEAILALEGKIKAQRTTSSFKDSKSITINGNKYYYKESYPENFIDVKGQDVAKRASLIASAGGHNILMVGSPGCGKSMIAKRLRWILPPLSEDEILATAKHQFLNGQTPSFQPIRAFRSPHHTATVASIFGGGSQNAKIGEVALAHLGVLFFDEVPHFGKNILEALREPMQDKVVNIARVNKKISYQSDFIFVGAMNPCPCGNLLSKINSCRCTKREIERYNLRLSEPFLDRIELFLNMQEVSSNDKPSLDSASMHQMVIDAFSRQKSRGQKRLNGKLKESEIEEFCELEPQADEILMMAMSRFGLSHRAVVSIKKVSRTIADLEDSPTINKAHLLEALSYRKR
jgi:magnesium chelatase family protein